mgnify:FL=1|jgi:hypothetical protein
MIWTTLAYIKQHSRICCDGEDGTLELYGAAAEKTVMNYLERDYDDIVGTFGTDEQPVPEPIRQATLMLVDVSYMQRSPVTVQNLYLVGYGFDALLKPYMRLSGTYANDQRNAILSQLLTNRQDLEFYKPDGADEITERINSVYTRFAGIPNPSARILKTMRKEADEIAAAVDALVNPTNENTEG